MNLGTRVALFPMQPCARIKLRARVKRSKTLHQQRTIKKSVGITGIGLHSGKVVELELHPALADQGIVFERVDIPGRPRVKATYDRIVATELASTLGTNGVRVMTVEHLLAAFYGMGIDNILVEIDGDEVPIMDGSAGPFIKHIRAAGIRRLARSKKFFVIRKEFSVHEGDRMISVKPCHEFRISCTINFDHPAIERQGLDVLMSAASFEKEISRARTFGFIDEVLAMQAKGLARGGGLHNAVVVDKTSVLNAEGLRFPDEFVRHKVLDIIGDLALLGGPLIGHIEAYKTGHELNNRFVKGILADPSIYSVMSFDQPEEFCASDPELDTWQMPDWAAA